MAYDDDLRVRIQLADSRRDVAHRDMKRARQGRDCDFLGLADVEDHERLAALQPMLQRSRSDFTGFRHRRAPPESILSRPRREANPIPEPGRYPSRFALADSAWPVRSGRFALAVVEACTAWTEMVADL